MDESIQNQLMAHVRVNLNLALTILRKIVKSATPSMLPSVWTLELDGVFILVYILKLHTNLYVEMGRACVGQRSTRLDCASQ